ncbi:MAG: inositol monophosphatase [Alphaproteobacteria bacterium]
MMQSALINVMSAAAIKAGKGLLRDFGEVDNLQVSRKGAHSFVTSADIRTEKLLQRELSKARPAYGFMMEETGEIEGTDPTHRWIVDPLDGTSNFIHAIPYFCISIGVEKKTASGSQIIAGVIYDPIHNELFSAEQYAGAFLNNRRLVTAGRENLSDAMLVCSGPKHMASRSEKEIEVFGKLTNSGACIRRLGATALDLAHIAAGRVDGGFYDMIQPWDIAAGSLMVQEAGGQIVDFSGKTATLDSRTLIASSRALSPALARLSA